MKNKIFITVLLITCFGLVSQAQDTLPEFPSSREVLPSVIAKIQKGIFNYLYFYSIKNKIGAKQSISNFLVQVESNTYGIYSSYNWRKTKIIRDTIKAVAWYSLDSLKNIFGGGVRDSFIVESNALPKILKYFASGDIEWSLYPEGEYEFRAGTNDVFYNSYKGFTIAPADPLFPFIATDFVDSIKIYSSQSFDLGWIKTQLIKDKYNSYLTNAKLALQQNNISVARTNLQSILHDVDIDSSGAITSEAYALLRYNTEYLLSKLPQPSGMIVRLVNSNSDILTGGTLQYYEGGWKNAVDNQDGTFLVNTNLSKASLRMTYAYGSQTLSNVTVGSNIVTFKTINATVQLKNSLGNLIDQGTVQYYSGAWRDFGTTTNGVATKELLPNNYSFRMSYAFASNDKQQNIGADPTVIFQTVNAAVQLKNSLGNLIDAGTVQYYSGAWRDFGTTTNGVVTKELLRNNYSFRMSYAFASNDKQQNIGADPTVVFQTVNATAQLKNSLGNLIDAGTVQYYSGAWRDFGTTTSGVATKELLPNNYSFRMSYAFASNDKQQNIGTDPTVVFQTVNATVQLKNSLGSLIDVGTVQYYSGAWRNFGATSTGIASLELLPNNYSFRITHEFISNDKAQNIGTNNIVEFRTVLCNVNVTDAQNLPVNDAVVSYYSGAWRNLGMALNGTITKELLPANLTFRAISGSKQVDKTQNILTNNIVEIKLP